MAGRRGWVMGFPVPTPRYLLASIVLSKPINPRAHSALQLTLVIVSEQSLIEFSLVSSSCSSSSRVFTRGTRSRPKWGFIDMIQARDNTAGWIGHSYFTSDPRASADLMAVLRYGLRPNEPGRPLEEIERPFWQLPTQLGAGSSK
jgi:hypothetical protein